MWWSCWDERASTTFRLFARFRRSLRRVDSTGHHRRCACVGIGALDVGSEVVLSDIRRRTIASNDRGDSGLHRQVPICTVDWPWADAKHVLNRALVIRRLSVSWPSHPGGRPRAHGLRWRRQDRQWRYPIDGRQTSQPDQACCAGDAWRRVPANAAPSHHWQNDCLGRLPSENEQ